MRNTKGNDKFKPSVVRNIKNNNDRLASEIVGSLSKKDKDGKTSFAEIVSEFQDIGFCIIMILLSMPIAIPLPYPPGSTALFGIPLMILSVQMMLGFHEVRLPRMIENYKIANRRIILFADKAIPILLFIEKYLRVRLQFATSKFAEKIIGFISFICSIAISSPIPFTHSIPAWGIAIMSLGLLRRDGIVVFLGMIVSAVGLFISYGAVLLTINLIKAI